MSFYDVTMTYFNQMLEYRKSTGFATTTYEYSIPLSLSIVLPIIPMRYISRNVWQMNGWNIMITIPTVRNPYLSQCCGDSQALSMHREVMRIFPMKIILLVGNSTIHIFLMILNCVHFLTLWIAINHIMATEKSLRLISSCRYCFVFLFVRLFAFQ